MTDHKELCEALRNQSAYPLLESLRVRLKAADLIEYQSAENADMARMYVELEALGKTMADLLIRTTNALKGEPAPEGHVWGWQDLPEIAKAAKDRIAELEASPWRQMSEAPTDNTEILIRESRRNDAVLVRCLDGEWLDENGVAFDAVAWMEIPPMVTA